MCPAPAPSSLEDVWWREGRRSPCQSSLQVLEVFLENVICDTVTSTEQAKRKTSGARDTACTMKHPPWIWERASPHATEQSLSQETSRNPSKNHTKCTAVSGNGSSDPAEQAQGPNQVPPPAKRCHWCRAGLAAHLHHRMVLVLKPKY